MFRVLMMLTLISPISCLSLFSENLTTKGHKELMQVETFSRTEVLPLLPLLHDWCAKHLVGFPYYYAPPKEQIIHPFDTVYVNEKEALVVIAKESNAVIGIASGVALGSFYLDYNLGYVFSPELMQQFKEKGFSPNEVLYVGYFLMAEDHRENAEAVFGIFDQLIAAAKNGAKSTFVTFKCFVMNRE